MKRCKHDKNFTISEQGIIETVFHCTDGEYEDEGLGYASIPSLTGIAHFQCFDCGLDKFYNRLAKSTPQFVKDAWEKLMEVQAANSSYLR